MKISLAVGLAALTAGGIMYIVSGGGKMIETAKATMKYAGIGLIVILSAWLIINYTIQLLGPRPGMGINVTSWGEFDCSANKGVEDAATQPTPGAESCANKKLKSLEVQCENGPTNSISLASNATNDKPNIYQLKAIAKYDCNGKENDEDVTDKATWTMADDTIAKTDKGMIKAISTGDTTVKVAYSGNTVDTSIFVDSCPLAYNNSDGDVKLGKSNVLTDLFSLNSYKAQAADCPVCGSKFSMPPREKCALVSGNANAPIVIFIGRVNVGQNAHVCESSLNWDKDSDYDKDSFKTIINEFASELDYISEYKDQIALYSTDKIYNSYSATTQYQVASDCLGSAAYDNRIYLGAFIDRGANQGFYRAYTTGGETLFCEMDITMNKVKGLFAHETIGHALAQLNDEYNGVEGATDAGQLSFLLNCTKDSTCSKWKTGAFSSFQTDCIKGCYNSDNYYRSSDVSIMRSLKGNNTGFSPLQKYIIGETIKNAARCAAGECSNQEKYPGLPKSLMNIAEISR